MKVQKHPRVAPFGITLLFALCCGLASSGIAGGEDAVRSEEAIRSGQRLAALMAAKKTVADLAQTRIGGLERVWTQQILRDLPRHVKAVESRQILAADYRERLRRVLAERLRRIHTSFHPPGQKDHWFTEAWLTDQVQTRMRGPVEQSLSRNAEHHLAAIFGAARQAAVREQSSRLSTAVYPTVKEVETLAKAGWDQETQERIGRALVERMSRGTTLLEETAHELQETAGAAVAEAHAQFESQAEALNQPVPEEARAAEDIARALASHLEEARLQRTMAGGGRPVYGTFPTIQRLLRARAESLEKERFQAFCQTSSLAVSEARVSSLIQGDLRRHRSPEASKVIFTKTLLPEAAAEAVKRYVRSIADPKKAAAFRARLQSLTMRNQEVRDILQAGLDAALDPPLRSVRSSLAQSQLESHFPRVASGRWSAPERVLLQIVQGELGVRAFEECLELPQLPYDGRPYQHSALLMETEDLVLLDTSKLLAEGEAAWKEQEKVVRHFEIEIPKAIRESKEDRSVEEWEKHFVEKAETRWREQRGRIWRGASAISPYAARKYVDLFQYMRELIRKHVKNEFEIAKQPQTPTLSTRAPDANIAGPAPQVSSISGGGPGGGGQGAGSGGSKGTNADGSGEGGAGECPDGTGQRPQRCCLDRGPMPGEAPLAGLWSAGFVLLVSLLAFLGLILGAVMAKINRADVWWAYPVVLILFLVIAGVAWRTQARFLIQVTDLEEASCSFEHLLGVAPERVGKDAVIFKRGPFNRILLRQRAEPFTASLSGAGARR